MRLGKALADWLIEEGLANDPYTPTNGGPFISVDPAKGAPAPEDINTLVNLSLTLQTSGGFGTAPYQEFLDRRTITLIHRCQPNKEKELIDASNAIDLALDGKRAFSMAGLRVEIAQLYRPLIKIPTSMPAKGSVYESEYLFLIRKSSLIDPPPE